MSATDNFFEDYDDEFVYERIEKWLLGPGAHNFVVEFGQDEAKIATDLDFTKFQRLVKHNDPSRPASRPVRWINIWAPNEQSGIIDVISDCYGFSHRFRAILKTAPTSNTKEEFTKTVQGRPITPNEPRKNDVEYGNGATERKPFNRKDPGDVEHYDIASHLVNFQSLDLGEKFLCVGANWMYYIDDQPGKESLVKRLWSWLILCDDSTVISLHEDSKACHVNEKCMKATQRHIMNVLCQLSDQNTENGGSMSLVSVRKILKADASHHDHGSEGSSNLFYYLFDNWRSAYHMITGNQRKLEILSKQILNVVDEKHRKPPHMHIITKLYEIGKQLRTNQGLYKSYDNLIERILKYKAGPPSQSGKRVSVALTACERFERLGDRIKLLVLSPIEEAIAEKDALLSTYFQITAQIDSAATAKLSRNATLLSKLGVLFLPVGLMTSYFSVQIDDLQGVYSSKTYWVCFAVVMALSIIALFFLSRALTNITESLERRVKITTEWCKMRLGGKHLKDV